MENNLEGQIIFSFGVDKNYINFDDAYDTASDIQRELIKNEYSVMLYVEENSIILEYTYNQNKAISLGSGFLTAISPDEFQTILDMRYPKEDEED